MKRFEAHYMLIFVSIVFALSTLTLAKIIRDPRWPEDGAREKWQFDRVIPFCLKKTGVAVQTIDDFSEGEDLDKLPDDPKLKAYMHCQAVEWGVMTENSTSMHFEHILEHINGLDSYYQDIYLKMARRCSSKAKDPKEKVYALHVCYKKNDIVHYILLSSVQFFIDKEKNAEQVKIPE